MTLPRFRLPGTDLEVPALGFGCVRLTTCRTDALAQRTLATALDHGITHFDTARLYGAGHSERILGRFLRGRRDRVTVATKLGLVPPTGLSSRRTIVKTVKRALAPFPTLLDYVQRRTARGDGGPPPRGRFDVETARASLETSLRALGTDYVDVLLLHEATPEDARSAPLQDFLAEQCRRGTVRAVGVASDFGKYGGHAADIPAFYGVLQFDHSAVDPHLDAFSGDGRGKVVFGVLAPLSALVAAAKHRPDLCRHASTVIGVDLSSVSELAALLLSGALAAHRDGITLFSSTSPATIAANAAHAGHRRFDAAQLATFSTYARIGRATIAGEASSA